MQLLLYCWYEMSPLLSDNFGQWCCSFWRARSGVCWLLHIGTLHLCRGLCSLEQMSQVTYCSPWMAWRVSHPSLWLIAWAARFGILGGCSCPLLRLYGLPWFWCLVEAAQLEGIRRLPDSLLSWPYMVWVASQPSWQLGNLLDSPPAGSALNSSGQSNAFLLAVDLCSCSRNRHHWLNQH